jgi:hypothetical protein
MPTEQEKKTTEERLQEVVKSPKTAAVFLAVGSALWRAIAAWSNVDFILSVREERIAMILEFLLDWGWLIIIIVAVLWAVLAPRTSADKTKVNFGMAIAASVIFFMTGVLATNRDSSIGLSVLPGWGGDLTDCWGTVDTSRLVGFKNRYRIVLLCGITNSRVDPFEDDQIAISEPFTITGQQTTIETSNGNLQKEVDKILPGTGSSLWHGIALLPSSVQISELKRPSDLERRGGIFVTDPKVGGFPQVIFRPAPPPPTPLCAPEPKKKDK